MTRRSALLGLAGAVGICGVTFLNDRVLKGTYLIGNNMPVAVYGTLIVFVVLVNPLFRRLALTGREIAVVMALTLAACCIPSSGLLRTFTDVLVMPRHFGKTEPGWAGGSCALSDDDVRDWPAFLRALEAAGAGDGPARSVWGGLAEGLRDRIVREAGQPSVELRAEVREELDALVRGRSWPEVEDLRRIDLPAHVERFAETSADELSDQEVEILGRTALEVLFAGHIEPRRVGILEEVPQGLLVEAGRDEEHVVGDFVQGQSVGTEHISVDDVPWGAWVRPLSFWVPLVLVLLAATVCLSVIVHRQWSQHELLPYPMALFADSLLPDGNGGTGARASVFRSRLFWISAGVVLAIHLNNYLFQWAPQYLFPIPTRFDFGPMRPLLPTIARGGGWFLFYPKIYFIVIGIAYFAAKDVSLSFAAGPVLWTLVVGLFAGYGISLQAAAEGAGYWMSASPRTFIVFGACLGVFLVLAYTGRRFYASVALRAFGRPAEDDVHAAEVWAFRALVVLTLVFVVMLAFGADIGITYALLYTAIAFIGFVVTGRVIAETGLFHIQIMVFPCIIMWGLFGARLIGVKALLVMQIVSVVLFIDPRESLMPFMVNSLKLLERRRAALGKPAALAVLAIVLGLAVVLPVTLYIQYDQGLTNDYWAEHMVPKMPFDNAVSLRYKYEAQGLRTSTGTAAADEEARFKPITICVYALVAGTLLVLAFTVARLRLTWWPLHPLMFVLWATNHAKHFAVSFFIGWAVKALVVKYGGNNMYERLKPLMVGLIAGEVLGAFVPCIAGAVYYVVTGEPPKAFHVLPG